MSAGDYQRLFRQVPDDEKVLIDVKSILNPGAFASYRLWRL